MFVNVLTLINDHGQKEVEIIIASTPFLLPKNH